jgi:hypothetical protein
MNKILKISFFAFAIFLLSDTAAFAQRRPSKKTDEPTPTDGEKKEETTRPTRGASKSTDKYFDESGGFKHRLWYGGNLILNFAGNSYGSAFAVGVTPMVGYKIIGDLSAGPRAGLVYNSQSAFGTRVSWTDYSAGVFTRYKFLGFLFLHAEYGYSSQFSGLISPDGKGGYNAVKINRFNPYLGGGYNSSNGIVGYEIALLYDPTLANNPNLNPLDIRFGFNYNF